MSEPVKQTLKLLAGLMTGVLCGKHSEAEVKCTCT
jgi:hypothetical protein